MKQICQNGINSMGFNRYMVECECKRFLSSSVLILVLIDTWWNVNYYGKISITSAYKVLIDTWWNVNLDETYHYSDRFSFNRYMVECELHKSYMKIYTAVRF